MCRSEVPSLVDLFNTYHDDRFKLITVHFPYAGSSLDAAKIKEQADNLGVTYPVVVDNDLSLWNAYGNRVFPSFYGIDRQGNIRFAKFGGGDGMEAVFDAVKKLKEFG